MKHDRLSWLAVLFIIAGCAGDEPPTLDELQDDLQMVGAIGTELACECYAEHEPVSFDSEEECRDNYTSERDPTVEACLDDAYALDTAGSRAHLACYVAAFEQNNQCYRDILMCTDYTGTHTECALATLDALNACPELPAVVEQAVQACIQNQAPSS